jgi:hypothetical protein
MDSQSARNADSVPVRVLAPYQEAGHRTSSSGHTGGQILRLGRFAACDTKPGCINTKPVGLSCGGAVRRSYALAVHIYATSNPACCSIVLYE